MASIYSSKAPQLRESRRSSFQEGGQIVVVGNGMVGAHFCKSLVEKGLHKSAEIIVIGAEEVPAYDRIRLSSYVDHRSREQLTLLSLEWYEEHGIKLQTGVRVTEIDRALSTVRLSDGQAINYQALVLAMGSRPFVPPIAGTDLPNVFLYRTIEDLQEIIEAAEGRSSATVIGGGLLGLEAAQALQKLGLEATVVERAQFLMPQQLNQKAAQLLQETVEKTGIELLLAKSAQEITQAGKSLTLSFSENDSVTSDLIVISAGISPNSELAAEADLPVGVRGGVVVNDHLETEDENILAIGECALLHGRIYGLAAPGYQMANHVAARLAGEKLPALPPLDLSTRLKMLGAEVVTIGNPLEEGRQIEFITEDSYRMLIVSGDRTLIGGLGVGPWPESGKIQSLFTSGAIIREKEESYFLKEGILSPDGDLTDVTQWPDERIVCNCLSLSKGTILDAVNQEGPDFEKVSKSIGCSTVCGSCQPLCETLCGQTPSLTKPKGFRMLITVSSLALVAAVVTIFAPPPAMADSVLSWWYKVDQLWRSVVYKQITGYSLLALSLFALTLSLRKRLRWLRLGHFARWRGFHALFGLTSLIVLFVHTGFRFGHNLNFWLMFTFVGLNVLGAVAGVVSAIESKGTSKAALTARRFRPWLTYAHLILFWPLPVLLTFHILSVYLY